MSKCKTHNRYGETPCPYCEIDRLNELYRLLQADNDIETARSEAAEKELADYKQTVEDVAEDIKEYRQGIADAIDRACQAEAKLARYEEEYVHQDLLFDAQDKLKRYEAATKGEGRIVAGDYNRLIQVVADISGNYTDRQKVTVLVMPTNETDPTTVWKMPKEEDDGGN